MQEDKDKLYQRLHPGIMIISDDEEHPYLYGQVLGFFHVNIKNNGPNSMLERDVEVSVPVVWIRWLKLDQEALRQSGFHSLRYPSVSFYDRDHPDAFGFVHPDEIVRAVHLIPRFKFGRTGEHLDGTSRAQPEAEGEDWKHFNVNMWVTPLYHSPSSLLCSPTRLDSRIVTHSCGSVGVELATSICEELSSG